MQAVAILDLVVFNKEMLQFENLISMAGLFQNFFACKRYAEKGRADPMVFNKEMLLFENLISMAGSFQNFVDCKR